MQISGKNNHYFLLHSYLCISSIFYYHNLSIFFDAGLKRCTALLCDILALFLERKIILKKPIGTFRWILTQSRGYLKYTFILMLIGGLLSILGVYRAIASKKLVDTAILGSKPQTTTLLILLAILIIAEICLSSTNSILSARCRSKLSASIQKRIYDHILNCQWMELSGYHSSSLSTRLCNDADAVANAVTNTMPHLFTLIVLLASSFTALLYLEPAVALAAIIISPVCIFFSKLYGSKLKGVYKDSQEADALCRSFLQESVQNILILKTFCLERENYAGLSRLQDKKISLAVKKGYINTLSNTVIRLGSWSTFFIIFCWGANNLSGGVAAFGTLTALLQLISGIQAPFYGLASSVPELVASVGSAERLMELTSIPKEVEDNTDMESCCPIPDNSLLDIEFRNVCFSYKKNESLLKNLSFTVKAGEIIGLIGASGEGKTTIVRLLLALVTPDKGHIFIKYKGRKYQVSPSSRRFISYVPQGNTLFSGTVKSNLLHGNLTASDWDIHEAAVSSCSADFIEQLKDKYETVIGEKGSGLSEGQAQRLAIARAFLRKKPILVLDEATSSLDTETEAKILRSIRDLKHKPTCIIITHRPSALALCNRIFKLEKGMLYEIYSDNSMPETVEERYASSCI
ncbi:hypothetical protein CDQ83_08720 [Clostridium thermosuccinogenes]|nr:hypothetical protein CDQ83_08720 [Pseudoclostridium thermosuccinogenes]